MGKSGVVTSSGIGTEGATDGFRLRGEGVGVGRVIRPRSCLSVGSQIQAAFPSHHHQEVMDYSSIRLQQGQRYRVSAADFSATDSVLDGLRRMIYRPGRMLHRWIKHQSGARKTPVGRAGTRERLSPFVVHTRSGEVVTPIGAPLGPGVQRPYGRP